MSSTDFTPAWLRRFGLTVGGLCLALAAFWWLRGRGPAWWGPGAGLGVALAVPALVAPQVLRRPARVWMGLGAALGFVTSRVVLTGLFVLVVTPLAVVARLSGRRFLSLGHDPRASSHWVSRRGLKVRFEKMY